jgi:hypothetical protein
MLRKYFLLRRFFVRRERIVYFIRKVFVIMVGELADRCSRRHAGAPGFQRQRWQRGLAT